MTEVTHLFADRELTLWAATQPPYVEPDVASLREGIATRARDRRREVEMRRVVDLSADGVTTTLRRDPGVVHNAVMLGHVSPACAACLQRVVADVARLLR